MKPERKKRTEKHVKDFFKHLFVTVYPGVEPYLIRNLVNASYDAVSQQVAYDNRTSSNSLISPRQRRKFVGDSVQVSRKHLDFSQFAFQSDHYAEAIYHAYLSLEVGSKTLNAIMGFADILDQKDHEQGKRQYQFLRDKTNTSLLRNIQPVLDTGLTLPSTQEIRGSLKKLDSYYDQNSNGFGLTVHKDDLERICNALVQFCVSMDSFGLPPEVLKTMTIKANKNRLFGDLRREHFEQISSHFNRFAKATLVRSMLLFLLEPHKNATRYVQIEFSPLNYDGDKTTATESMPLIGNLETIYELLDGFILDLQKLASDSQPQWLNVVSNSSESVYKTWKREQRRSRNRIARGTTKLRY